MLNGPRNMEKFLGLKIYFSLIYIFTFVNFRTHQTTVLPVFPIVGSMINIADPELAKQILVKDFYVFKNRVGSDSPIEHPILSKNLGAAQYNSWKRIRPLVSPTFTTGKMKKMYPLIDECSKYLIDNLEEHVVNGKDVIAKDLFGCLTIDIIAKCAFGTDTNAHKDKDNPFVVNGKQIFETSILIVLILNLTPNFILRMIGPSVLSKGKFLQSAEFFFNVSRHIIKERRQNNQRREDFLQLLMDCQSTDKVNQEDNEKDNEIDAESHHIGGNEQFNYNKQLSGKTLTDDEVIAQAFVFFIAGYETTAATLSYISYELALNQDIQNKLYEEIKTVQDEKGTIDYETLVKLPYLDAVIAESLRKYPPSIRVNRITSQKYQLGNTGITLDKGFNVSILAYAIHHNEEYYPSPEKFKPERFLPENRDQIKPFTYLPFGSGPRNCVGMRFALLETKLALVNIITRFKFVKSSKTQVPLEFLPNRLLLTPKSIIVGVERRN